MGHKPARIDHDDTVLRLYERKDGVVITDSGMYRPAKLQQFRLEKITGVLQQFTVCAGSEGKLLCPLFQIPAEALLECGNGWASLPLFEGRVQPYIS